MEKLTFHGYCELLWLGNFLHQPNTNEEKWGPMKCDENVHKCTKWQITMKILFPAWNKLIHVYMEKLLDLALKTLLQG